MPKDEKTKKELKFLTDASIPTSYVDNLIVTSQKEDIFIIRFLNALPEGLKEEARLAVKKTSLQEMLKVLCRQAGYYPKPDEKHDA